MLILSSVQLVMRFYYLGDWKHFVSFCGKAEGIHYVKISTGYTMNGSTHKYLQWGNFIYNCLILTHFTFGIYLILVDLQICFGPSNFANTQLTIYPAIDIAIPYLLNISKLSGVSHSNTQPNCNKRFLNQTHEPGGAQIWWSLTGFLWSARLHPFAEGDSFVR